MQLLPAVAQMSTWWGFVLTGLSGATEIHPFSACALMIFPASQCLLAGNGTLRLLGLISWSNPLFQ